MNSISRSIACMLICFSSNAFAQIPWVSDPTEAMKMARQSGKPVLLHFYTDSCAPCKMLEYRAFRDADFVKTVTELVIPVKINAEVQREFASDQAVTRWPTDVYLFPDGSELYRSVCPQDPAAYSELIKRVSVRCRDYLTELNSRSSPAKTKTETNLDGKTSAKLTSHETHPSISHERASHDPTKHSVREMPNIASTAPSHMAVISHRSNSKESGNSSDEQRNSQGQMDQPKVNRYRTQSATFNGGMQSPAQSIPSQILSPYVNQPAAQTMPNQQASAVPIQRSLISQVAAPSNELPNREVEDEIALDGYCPIILDQKRWEPGNPQLAVRHRGKIYYCSNEQARDAFLADPDRFGPMLSGYDVVRFLENGQIVNGKREYGCWFAGRVYLFDSEETRRIFDLNIERYVQQLQSLQAAAGRVASKPIDSAYR